MAEPGTERPREAVVAAAEVSRPASANASSRAITRNVVVNYVNLARATVLGILVTPIILRAVGTTAFGVWSLAIGAVGYIGLVETGITTALVTRVAAAEARGDLADLSAQLRTGARILAALAGVGTVLLAVLTLFFDRLFHVPPALAGEGRWTMLLLGASTMVAVAGGAYASALVGIGRVDITSLLGAGTATTLTVSQMVLALTGAGIRWLAAASLAVAVVELLLNRAMSRRKLRNLPRSPATWATARSMLSLGWRNALVSISGLLAFGSDILVVGAFAGPLPAAAYAVASRAATFGRNLVTSATDVLVPSFGNATAVADRERVRLLFRSTLLMGSVLAVPLAIVLGVFADPLLHLWVGTVPEGSGLVLAALAVLTVVQLPGHIAFLCLMGAQRSDLLIRYSLPNAAVNLLASIALTSWLGAVGPALGSIIATVLVEPLLIRRVARDVLQVPTRSVYGLLLSTLALPAVATALLALGARQLAVSRAILSPALAAGTAVLFLALTILWLRATSRGAVLAPGLRRLPWAGPRLGRLLVADG